MPRRSLWRHRDFLCLWGAESVSQLGSAVTLIALPLVAIEHLRATSFQLGLLTAAQFAPFLVVGLPAGVWVDRLPRRSVMLAADLGRVAVLASVPVAHWLDVLTMAQLYAVAFAAGVLTVFFDVAYQSYLPSLVNREQLGEGNAKLEMSRSIAQTTGPGIGGVLVDALSAPVAVAVDAASFLASAAGLVGIRGRERRPERDGARPPMRTQLTEGLRYVFGHPLLRPITLCTAIANLFSSMWTAVAVLFMVQSVGLAPREVGIVFALGNAGAVVGAALAGPVVRRVGLGRTIVWSQGLSAPFMLLVPAAPRESPIPFLVAAQVAISAGGCIYNVTQVSLRQAICPDRLLGRMNASIRFVVWGTLPIGAVIGGALGGTIGLRQTALVSALGLSLAFVSTLVSPVRELRAVPEEAPA